MRRRIRPIAVTRGSSPALAHTAPVDASASGTHRPELGGTVNVLPCSPNALLVVERRAWRRQLDCHGDQQRDRSRDEQDRPRPSRCPADAWSVTTHRVFRNPSEKINQLGRRFSTAILPCTPRTRTPGDRTAHPPASCRGASPLELAARVGQAHHGHGPPAPRSRSVECRPMVPMMPGSTTGRCTVGGNPGRRIPRVRRPVPVAGSWSSSARPTEAAPVPTSNNRSVGRARLTNHSNETRQPTITTTTNTAEIRKTPRPSTRSGNK